MARKPKTPPPLTDPRDLTLWRGLGSLFLLALIVLCVAWELWLAPSTASGVMALKALPLVAAVGGIVGGKRYTYQWLSLAVLLYVTEGAVRIFDPGLAGRLARVELLLSIALFVCVLMYARLSAPSRQQNI